MGVRPFRSLHLSPPESPPPAEVDDETWATLNALAKRKRVFSITIGRYLVVCTYPMSNTPTVISVKVAYDPPGK